MIDLKTTKILKSLCKLTNIITKSTHRKKIDNKSPLGKKTKNKFRYYICIQ